MTIDDVIQHAEEVAMSGCTEYRKARIAHWLPIQNNDLIQKGENFIMNYFEHLLANWRVAFHSLNDFIEHFIHGIFPFISWKHYHKED